MSISYLLFFGFLFEALMGGWLLGVISVLVIQHLADRTSESRRKP